MNFMFTKEVFIHLQYRIGYDFLCAGQMYNHIPGHGVLKRKDLIVDSYANYAAKFSNRTDCLSTNLFFPKTYRLYKRGECRAFFRIINSNEFKNESIYEPIQYLIKIGYGAHRAEGVFLFDEEEQKNIVEKYNNGKYCGQVRRSLVA